MKNHLLRMYGFGLAAILVAFVVADSHAGFADMWREKKRPTSGDAHLVSSAAEYTGALRGEIHLRGRRFRITRDTSIYVIGQGAAQAGLFVQNRPVSVSGTRDGGTLEARLIIVRPEKSPGAVQAMPNVPHTPSASNANVGVLQRGGAQ